MFKSGDIFIVHKSNQQNADFGYWNHIAILTDIGVVETQTGTIVCNKLHKFINKYSKIQIYRWNIQIGQIAAKHAVAMIDEIHDEDYCITMINKVYQKACDVNPRWKIPNDIVQDTRLTFIIEKIKDN